MGSFRYVAIDASGQVLRGTTEAQSAAAVVEWLQSQGQTPMRAEPAGQGGFLGDLLTAEIGRSRGLRQQDVADVTRELATMLAAGQDLDRALRFIVETAPNARVRIVMERIRGKVRNGSALASALAKEPNSFSRLYIGLVKAGEAGGTLAETLDRLAVLQERQRALAATVQSALIYPALLAAVAVGSIVLLLTQVLPQFVPMFRDNGAEVPRSARILLGLGSFTAVAGPWIAAALLVCAVAFRQALKDPRVRLPVDRLLLRLPIAGPLIRKTLAARFCRTLGTLLRNGVPLITALGIVKDAFDNMAVAGAVEAATASAKGGAGLARPLGEAGIFPERTIHLLRLGEETAQLAAMALRAAEIHEEEARLGVQRLVSLMVPVITILMGAAVAAIIGTLLTAMLSLNDLAL
jgi:general secretion pathway protein F